MRFGSVCSGIEAASMAWNPLGWEAAWFSEIDPFPSAVLSYHYPNVQNYGDMSLLPEKILSGDVEAPELFCGGTPCQAFSYAGLRKSLEDERGNLSLTFCEIANAIDSVRFVQGRPPAIIFWENVPGILNTPDNAFGCFLAGLAGEDLPLQPAGKKWTNAGCVFGPKRAIAWRILDAQYFGLAQRRKRVFVVASAREGFDPASILFEFEGMRRDTAPSREARKDNTGSTADGLARCITRGEMSRGDWETCTFIATPIGVTLHGTDGTQSIASVADVSSSLRARIPSGVENSTTTAVMSSMRIRRLTPRECERLQGFPDNFTLVPYRGKLAADGLRYKALGNSWAVPVVRWIGERIAKYK